MFRHEVSFAPAWFICLGPVRFSFGSGISCWVMSKAIEACLRYYQALGRSKLRERVVNYDTLSPSSKPLLQRQSRFGNHRGRAR
jgi:hypothetical protein